MTSSDSGSEPDPIWVRADRLRKSDRYPLMMGLVGFALPFVGLVNGWPLWWWVLESGAALIAYLYYQRRRCPACGKHLDRIGRLCPHCGVSFEPPSDQASTADLGSSGESSEGLLGSKPVPDPIPDHAGVDAREAYKRRQRWLWLVRVVALGIVGLTILGDEFGWVAVYWLWAVPVRSIVILLIAGLAFAGAQAWTEICPICEEKARDLGNGSLCPNCGARLRD